jgi:hypothetical protein
MAIEEGGGYGSRSQSFVGTGKLKQQLDNLAMIPNAPYPGFAHRTLSNGITVSTCQLCMKTIGSPTPTSLRMAEENHLHLCGSLTRKSK